METDGFVSHRSWLSPEAEPGPGPSTLNPTKLGPIFNDNPTAKSDYKRRQTTVNTSWTQDVRRRLAVEYPHLKPSSVILIESLPGCQRQAAHCDYAPSHALAAAVAEPPLLFLLAIQPDTRLDVWPGSHKPGPRPCRRRTLRLDAGDAVVFRAELVHAGSAYTTHNRRIHIYLDSPSVPRVPNRTWVIYTHGDAEQRRRILE